MFRREVRFYREVGPDIGVRVPGCWRAEDEAGGTYLELENLSEWREGAEPAAGARTLADLHRRWAGGAHERWPWLPRPDVSGLVEALYAERWPQLAARSDLTPSVRELGHRLLGRVQEAEREAAASGPPTLVHGDATSSNMRTSPDGVIALLDWEDYGLGPGVRDLGWFLVSSVRPEEWPVAIEAYGSDTGLAGTLAAAVGAGAALAVVGGRGFRRRRRVGERDRGGGAPSRLTADLLRGFETGASRRALLNQRIWARARPRLGTGGEYG